jgi:hypothetical protein
MTAQSASGSPLHAFLRRPAVAFVQTWLLPPALATAAVFAYFFMIVPEHSRPWYVPPPPKPGKSVIFRSMNRSIQVTDDVAAKAARKAATVRPTPSRSGTPTRPTPATTPTPAAAPSADPEGDIGFETPRPKAAHDELWERYAGVSFRAEPTDAAWATAHRNLLHQVFNLTRDATFQGAPDQPTLTLRAVECRSIRCELTIAGPYRHELDVLADAFDELRWQGAPLWRAVERPPVVPEASRDDDSDDAENLQMRLIVAFAADLPEPRALTLGDAPVVRATPQSGPTGAPSFTPR